MASGDQYGHLALWDLESRRKIAQTVLVAEAPVTGLLFSSDGLNLTSAAQDGSIQRWDLDPELWIERLCELADRDFTSEELEAYGVQPVCKKPLTQATMTPGP